MEYGKDNEIVFYWGITSVGNVFLVRLYALGYLDFQDVEAGKNSNHGNQVVDAYLHIHYIVHIIEYSMSSHSMEPSESWCSAYHLCISKLSVTKFAAQM